MLNLLIREDRHAIRKEYIFRFILVLLFFLVTASIFWGAVIYSFYIQVNSESEIIIDELEKVRNSSDSKNLNQMVALNNEIENLVSQFNVLNFDQSNILEEFLSQKQGGVNLNLISIDLVYNEEGVFANLEALGVSNTREDLVSYQNSLLSLEIFESVKIPFSSFAQNADIPFTVNIQTVELNNYFEDEN